MASTQAKRPAPANHIALPEHWPEVVRHALLSAVGLAWFSITYVRGWAANSPIARLRLKSEVERLRAEVAMLKEELRIKDARMARIEPKKRPHYPPHERLAILALRASRAWNTAQTARHFLLAPATVAHWMKRLEQEGSEALIRLPAPVNKFEDFAELIVRQLRLTAPQMGRRKIAELLARAGLHLSASSVRRMSTRPLPPLPPKPPKSPAPNTMTPKREESTPKIRAKRPNHIWNCDLTACPISQGFWVSWLPQCVRQAWPFAWWLLVIVDHYSRKTLAIRVFASPPSGPQVCQALTQAARRQGPPAHIITDLGSQFTSEVYRVWCRDQGVKPRYGALGQHGSIALTERMILTLKREGLRSLLMPLSLEWMQHEADAFVLWYNEHRPHRSLGGATPNEVFEARARARDSPRYEPRWRYPLGRSPLRGAPKAVRGKRGVRLRLVVHWVEGKKHLPVIELRRAA